MLRNADTTQYEEYANARTLEYTITRCREKIGTLSDGWFSSPNDEVVHAEARR